MFRLLLKSFATRRGTLVALGLVVALRGPTGGAFDRPFDDVLVSPAATAFAAESFGSSVYATPPDSSSEPRLRSQEPPPTDASPEPKSVYADASPTVREPSEPELAAPEPVEPEPPTPVDAIPVPDSPSVPSTPTSPKSDFAADAAAFANASGPGLFDEPAPVAAANVRDESNDESNPVALVAAVYPTPPSDAAPSKNSAEPSPTDRSTPVRATVAPPISEAVADAEAEPEFEIGNGRLLRNLRPFKNARNRPIFGGRLLADAPAPPTVEPVELAYAQPPVLTKENANLPPLDFDERDAENRFATRAELDKFREEQKSLSWSKGALRIVPYGFINLSVSSDTQRAVPGEFILYAQSEDVDSSADFSIDARTSRLGLKIDGPRIDALESDVRGCVEFDFQGVANGSKNKGGLQLRRAFVELVDPVRERRFLAGQEWEVISPVAPQMLNYLPIGFGGNMQYRRPQLRFEQGTTFSGDFQTLVQTAICDDVLTDYTSTAGVSPSSAAWPVVEARVAASFLKETTGGRPITLGVSGHVGEQNYRFSPLAGTRLTQTERVAIRTWSANFDFDAPLTETQRLQGEYFFGSNLSSFCGGINQGVDLYRRDGIAASGGWVGLHSAWTKKFATNVGYGVDKPDSDETVATSLPTNGIATARTRNEVYFVNFLYDWSKELTTGIETSYWETSYRKADVTGAEPVFLPMKSGKTTRIECAVRYSF